MVFVPNGGARASMRLGGMWWYIVVVAVLTVSSHRHSVRGRRRTGSSHSRAEEYSRKFDPLSKLINIALSDLSAQD